MLATHHGDGVELADDDVVVKVYRHLLVFFHRVVVATDGDRQTVGKQGLFAHIADGKVTLVVEVSPVAVAIAVEIQLVKHKRLAGQCGLFHLDGDCGFCLADGLVERLTEERLHTLHGLCGSKVVLS